MSTGWVQRIALVVLLCFVVGVSTSSASVEVTYEQIDANNFPFIFSTVSVLIDGQPFDGLDETNFSVTEDGRLQTDYFQVIPPSESGGSRIADVVFLIDNSGSMGDEIDAVKNTVNAFADALAAEGVDYRLGAVKFGNGSGPNPYVYGGGNLTDDLGTFHSWINSMNASGGYEPGLQAIINAVNTFNFRPGSVRHFLIITDEDSDGGALSTAISLSLANNIVVHAAVDCSFGSSYAHYCAPNTSISGATGGHVFPVVGPYDQILTDILGVISDTYIVRYKTDNPAYDGLQREVIIEATFNAESGNAVGYYTPGTGPNIRRSSETILMTATPQVEGGALTFTAYIVDNVPPGVVSASLFYRTTGLTDYVEVIMPNSGGTLYTGTVPGPGVQQDGLEYYITATDGQLSASDPTVDPGIYPYSIAVLPNVKPLINHTPITEAIFETPIDIECEVIDGTNLVDVVQLHYRKVGQLIYQITDMTNTSGNNYSAVIPPDFVTYDGVKYKIKAYDDLGVFKTDGPHDVDVPLDSDGDGLLDTWEINGYTENGVFIDLPEMGCDPQHIDILVEVDWMAEDCWHWPICHEHKLSEKTLNIIKNAFASLPIDNLDDEPGINIIIDTGQFCVQGCGDYKGGEVIPHQDNINFPDDYNAIETEYFDPSRKKLFHYCVLAHKFTYNGESSSGIAWMPGSGLVVSLGTNGDDKAIAGTFIHELGHNLGLDHGGNNGIHNKPNYLSVMNYLFQFKGLKIDGRQKYTYSAWTLDPPLDENNLNETVGITEDSYFKNWETIYYCDNLLFSGWKSVKDITDHINWDCDLWPYSYDTDVQADINNDNKFDILYSYNDLSGLVFDGGSIGTSKRDDPPVTTLPNCLTWEDLENEAPWPVSGFGMSPALGVVSCEWIPLWEDIDSSLVYELELIAAGRGAQSIVVLDSVYRDSSFESATEYKAVIRSQTEFGVYSEVSDTSYHSTYAIETRGAFLGQRSATIDVLQGREVVLKFRLHDLDGARQDEARYCYTLRRYHDPELKYPVEVDLEMVSVTNDLLESATFDETTGFYRLALSTANSKPGRWGGKILLDDGTGHWFGFNVIEDDTPPEESTEEESKEW